MAKEKDELTEPKAAPKTRAPDGAAEVRRDTPNVFADVQCTNIFADVKFPMTNIPAIQLVTTCRPMTEPFVMRECSMRDIRGPIDWPDDTPAHNMTVTYVPLEQDVRFCNANLRGYDERADRDSRMGFFHFYSDMHRRALCDHFVLTGQDRLLVEMKAQTFIHDTDEMFLVALNPKFMGLEASRDPDGSATLPGQGPTRLIKYWPAVKQYMITALPQPLRGAETELVVIGDDLLSLGATRTPVDNIGKLLFETHSFNPDRFIACR